MRPFFSLAILLGCISCAQQNAAAKAPRVPSARQASSMLRVTAPLADAELRSPLRIVGQARGAWFFEATFPVSLRDGHGKLIAQHYAQAKGEWMTERFVPFEAELTFATPNTRSGTLILHKANASGLSQHDAELRIPVRFVF
jgi:hypothetical protein